MDIKEFCNCVGLPPPNMEKYEKLYKELEEKSSLKGTSGIETFTYTFSECVENHVGMQNVGTKSDKGFSIETLKYTQKNFEDKGCKTELIHLNELLPPDIKSEDSAYILIVRNGINTLLNNTGLPYLTDELVNQKEQVDKKAFMKGRVVNKIARWNLCYANENQEPDYENKKGRLISFKESPMLNKIRESLPLFIGDIGNNLFAELNYYYNIKSCYIGYHGDTERRLVIGMRIGASFPLKYMWYQQSKPIGKELSLLLNHGDLYMMSEKAVGTDWMRKIIPTLRHSAGFCKESNVK